MTRMTHLTLHERWLDVTWNDVREALPPAPAVVEEIGCGPSGGFVPALLEQGYDAVGIDPVAPDGPMYRQTDYEDFVNDRAADMVIACTSLHHAVNLDRVLDHAADALTPGGPFVVVEWAWEHFDEPSARWCFARLEPAEPGEDPGWLETHADRWARSGKAWDEYIREWASEEGLHTSARIEGALDERFECRTRRRGPYFFSDLANTSQDVERAAIESGSVRATGLHYVGRPRRTG